MRYAEVCVNSPLGLRQTFSYSLPPGLSIEVGQAVWVPFGQKLLQGVVIELTAQPAVEETKEITGIIPSVPVLSRDRLELARWLSEHYLSSLYDAVALLLPPGFEQKTRTFVTATASPDDAVPASLSQEQRHTLELVTKEGKISLAKLEKALGKKKAQTVVTQLVRRGLLLRSYEIEPARAKPRVEPYLSLVVDSARAGQAAAGLRSKRAAKQASLLDFLIQEQQPVPWAEARKKLNVTRAIADALSAHGLVKIELVEVRRDSLSHLEVIPSPPPQLTSAQESALSAIRDSQVTAATGHLPPAIFLLHGVTGSGKTEVYLQALAEAVRLGKRGIVLVPEIALTPQTIERFAARFPRRVAILHSQLSLGEQFDEWRRISSGQADVVIGPRSAIFAPQPNLGLIVIDEEHEWSYKQSDTSPRYHARDVATKLAELSGAVVILGSATPDVETFYHAQRGDYRLLQLTERVASSPLPQVELVDLRDELKAGNLSLLSRSLSRAITRTVARGEQVILFLNRRGAATFVQCRSCGFVLRCKRCATALTYHLAEGILLCHQCNYHMPVPRVCPQCSSPRIKFLGTGTEKVEQEVSQAFVSARLLRWDSDTTRQRHAHEEILHRFRDHQADILIGTQMITKGLDLPRVTLVGVINADTGLNLPDFRAGERTFQLLSQVAGRTGRGALEGQAIIQSYSPEHYAIQTAARRDYALFYEKEIAYRRQLHNPPFSQLASLIYSHTNDSLGQKEAERVKSLLIEEQAARGIAGLSLIGPAPAFMHRLRGKFRWQLILRGNNLSAFLAPVPLPQGWSVDIEPVGLS